MKKLLATALLLLAAQGASAAGLRTAGAASYAPGELLVFFKAGAGLDPVPGGNPKISDARAALHVSLGAQLLARVDEIDMHRVKLPAGAGLDAVTALYLQSPLVKKVARNAIAHALSCGLLSNPPNDPIYTSGQYQPWYGAIHADLAYSDWVSGCITLTGQVIVAVTDTGLSNHSQLNGLAVAGASFVDGVTSTDDDEGHGTFVTGIIAALTNDGAGPAGVFFDSSLIRIMPVKVLSADGTGPDSGISQGIIYAADHGAKIINMSLGNSIAVPAVEDAVNYAYNKGVLIVASSGNHFPGDNAATVYPAAYANVVSVGALDSANTTTYYSNIGKVDICAPGGDATSFDETGCYSDPSGVTSEIWGLCNASSGYFYGAGTSFSCPMVVGTAALLLSQDPTRNNGDLQRILEINTDSALPGTTASNGAGRVDVYKALNYGKGPDSVPGINLSIYNWPNPFNPSKESTRFTFSLSQRMDVDLRVTDISGDLVFSKHLDANQTFAGDRANRGSVTWDGKNGGGLMVANGVYMVSISAGGKHVSNRVAVIR